MIFCKKCNKIDSKEEPIQHHHIIPKSIGGTDRDGRIYLCKKCHDILHNIYIKLMWKYIPNQEEVKRKIKWFVLNVYTKEGER